MVLGTANSVARVRMTKQKVLIIEVTQDDIDKGIPLRSEHCPIALAALRQTGKSPLVVGPMLTLYGDEDDAVAENWVSRAASIFTSLFDSGQPVEPIAIFYHRAA